MKKLVTMIFSFMCLMGVSAAGAADLKVGVLNMTDVLENSKRMQTMSNDMKKQFDPTRNKILAEEKKISEMKDKYSKEMGKMNESQKADMSDKIVASQKALQQKEQNFIRQVQEQRTAVLKKSLDELSGIVEGIAQKEHFDLILQNGNIVYVSKMIVDITPRVQAAFDSNTGGKKAS